MEVLLYRLRRLGRKPEKVWGIVFLILLFFLVVIPLFFIIVNSFLFDSSGSRLVPGAQEGTFTLFYWARVLFSKLSNSLFFKPGLHSLAIALGMTAISLVLGSLLAYIVVRTDIPFKRFFSVVLIIPYIAPSWTIALAWIMLFKNERFGGTPGMLNYFFGINAPEWLAYGYIPIVISLGVHYIPYTFILMRGVLANIDSRLEESADILGASRAEVLRKITFPIALPALGSAFILTFSKGLGEFATQSFLGLPVRYYTLSTRIYSSMHNQLFGEGYVMSLMLILVTVVMVFTNQQLIGSRKRFVTVEGKGSARKPQSLGKWRKVITIAIFVFIVLFVFGPLILLGWQTLMLHDGQYGFDNLTLHYWFGEADPAIAEGQPGIFRNPYILNSIKNSVSLAGITALISGVVGILIGYTVVRNRKNRFSRWLQSISFIPYMIPGIAFGGIFLTMFARSWGPMPALYGTFTLLVLTCTVKYLPFSTSSGIAAMHQIDPSLEEVGVIHNIGWGKRFARIVMPLSKSGILSAMLLTFITTMRALDIVVLLVTPKAPLMTSIIFRYQSQEFMQHAYAIMLVIIFIVVSGHLILNRIGGKIEL
jgi:iron(III) transport system permease protein